MRWGLAWSFLDTKLDQFDYMKVTNDQSSSKKGKPVIYDFPRACFKEQEYNPASIFGIIEKLFVNHLWASILRICLEFVFTFSNKLKKFTIVQAC